MSYFYGRLKGNAGDVTRQGTKASGIRATVETHNARIRVQLYIWNDVDMVRITAEVADEELVIFNGKLEDAANREKVYRRIAKQLIMA